MAKNKNITAVEMASLIKEGDRTYSAADAYELLRSLERSRANAATVVKSVEQEQPGVAPSDVKPQATIDELLNGGCPEKHTKRVACAAGGFPSLTNTLLILIAFFLFLLVCKN